MKVLRALAVLIPLSLSALPSCPAAESQNPGPKPVLVLLEKDPWLVLEGSDNPTFVLYEDGLALYARAGADQNREYYSAHLDPAAIQEFLAALPLKDLIAAPKKIPGLRAINPQVMNVIQYWENGKRRKKVSMEGNLRQDLLPRDPATLAFLKAFKYLTSYSRPEEKPWLPAQIEVLFFPFPAPPEPAPAPWPGGWPGLDHPETRRRGDAFSLFLPSDKLPELRRWVEGLENFQPVRISGKVGQIALRFPFPGEEQWARIRNFKAPKV